MSRLKIRFIGSVVVAVALLGFGAGAAFAHGETVKTDPEKNASLDAAPPVVTVNLSEPPTDGSLFEVTDGCGRNVAAHVTAEGNKLIAHLEAGQPGKWKAAYRIVSAADGHPSDGSWSFTVNGDADCNEEDESTSTSTAPTKSTKSHTKHASESEEDTERVAGTPASGSNDGGFPLIPVAVGAVAVLGAAAFVRAKTT
ncbi:MAG: copper resistance protein CopC [Actinomycetota bacterium]|nr:copper resistance protein CopC [Actinomycetota bacterium]